MLLFLPFFLLHNVSDGIHVGAVTDSAEGSSSNNGMITERGHKEQERVTEEGKKKPFSHHKDFNFSSSSETGGSELSQRMLWLLYE